MEKSRHYGAWDLTFKILGIKRLLLPRLSRKALGDGDFYLVWYNVTYEYEGKEYVISTRRGIDNLYDDICRDIVRGICKLQEEQETQELLKSVQFAKNIRTI